MSLKTTNKNRKNELNLVEEVIEDTPWVPLEGLAKKETILDVLDVLEAMEVERMWTPLPKIHKET